MNEKLQYATMLEIPVNTCNVTHQITKKKRNNKKKKVNPEEVKEALLTRINSQTEETFSSSQETGAMADSSSYGAYQSENQAEYYSGNDTTNYSETTDVYDGKERKEKKKFKFTVIGVQLAVIGVLIATIFLTNAFYADSGINVFFKSVFNGGNDVDTIDARTYEDFAPVISIGDGVVDVSEGVISFDGKGSVYAPCDGTVSSIVLGEDEKYTVEITHSDNFKSVLKGLDFAYALEGDTVFSNIPVGYYSGEGASMCFMSGEGTVISDYQIVDSSVVWEV